MYEWLSQIGKRERVLDLGSGSGSFDYTRYSFRIIALDTDFNGLSKATPQPHVSAVNGQSHYLPFKDHAFKLVICNNTMEHFHRPEDTIAEIGRILTEDGMLIITVPNGYGFDDGLYRFLLEGGGHVNRFRFKEMIALVEKFADIRLVRWHELYSSFVYLRKPLPSVIPHLRSRFRRIARLPGWIFYLFRFVLNVLVRLISRLAGSEIALYGWAFFFRRADDPLIQSPAPINVCMRCGGGSPAMSLTTSRLLRVFYRCTSCKEINPYFKPHGNTV